MKRMRDNVITAKAGERNYVKTDPVYQYDYGLRLVIDGVTLPEGYEVHFDNINGKSAKTVIGTAEGVDVPDEYLRSGKDILAWLYCHTGENDGETVLAIHIPVIERSAISEQEITPIERDVIDQALAAMAEAVEQTEENVRHYPVIGDNEHWMVWDAEAGHYQDTGVKAHGEDGKAIGLTIGEVVTLPPGAPATANVRYVDNNPVLDLGLPSCDPAAITPIHDEQTDVETAECRDGANGVALADLKLRIVPDRTGSGVPGPRNIRRMSGHTGGTLTHNSTTHSWDWADEAGTVYSGVLEPMTGTLTVDQVFVSLPCTSMNNGEYQPGWKNAGIRDLIGADVNAIITGADVSVGTSFGVDTTGDNDILYLGYDQYHMRQTEWINTEINVQILIPLAEPRVYNLDPVQLATVLGDNAWSFDHGKIAYIRYACDTKKYIDTRIAELQAMVLEG